MVRGKGFPNVLSSEHRFSPSKWPSRSSGEFPSITCSCQRLSFSRCAARSRAPDFSWSDCASYISDCVPCHEPPTSVPHQGTTVTLSTKTGQRYEGVILSTSPEGDTAGVTLKDVKEISKPGTPLKESLFVASANIENWQSGPADAKLPNGDSESANPIRLTCCLLSFLYSLFQP